MFGENDEDEPNGSHVASSGDSDRDTETWNEMVQSVEEAAAQRVEKEREPFQFDVFRDEDGELTQWALMTDKTVEGNPSRVPVVTGSETESAMWYDYQNRFHQDREQPTVFEWVQKERVVPSNVFYAWLSDAVEAIAQFHAELDKVDDDSVFRDVAPDLPPMYSELNSYEAHALRFFSDILLEHRNYTEDQSHLIHEAVRRYPVDEDVWDAFTGEAFEDGTESDEEPVPIHCGCGEYAVYAPDGTVDIDVICPECGNHFGQGTAHIEEAN